VDVVASLPQGRTAAAQCGLFTYKSVPVIFEPPCNMDMTTLHYYARNITFYKHSKHIYEEILHQLLNKVREKHNMALYGLTIQLYSMTVIAMSYPRSRKENMYDFLEVRSLQKTIWSLHNVCLKALKSVTCYILLGCCKDAGSELDRNVGACKPIYVSP